MLYCIWTEYWINLYICLVLYCFLDCYGFYPYLFWHVFRKNALQVIAVDGVCSGVIQCPTTEDCLDWLQAIATNISALTKHNVSTKHGTLVLMPPVRNGFSSYTIHKCLSLLNKNNGQSRLTVPAMSWWAFTVIGFALPVLYFWNPLLISCSTEFTVRGYCILIDWLA